MVLRNKRRFIKKNQKMILLVGVLLIVAYLGLPYLSQSGYDLGDNVIKPKDVSINPGEYVDLEWKLDDGTIWMNSYWGYQIYKIVDGVKTPVYNNPIEFIYSTVTDTIRYSFIVEGTEGDSFEVVLEVWEDPNGVIVSSDTVSIIISGETTTEAIPTSTIPTTLIDDDGFDDMTFFYAMVISGGIIFILAVGSVLRSKMR